MERDYFVSVAIATYNGEKYLKEQLETILSQLKEKDEIIISDDGSTDNTKQIIRQFNDDRIKIIEGPKKGVKQNFANAISNCNGKYIFLADQDDLWMENKVEEVLKYFNSNSSVKCVLHDCVVFDSENGNTLFDSFFKYRKCKKGILKNIIKNSYIGCCMAFDCSLKKRVLPIPQNIEMHDQWIGLLAEKNGEVIFSEKKLIKYRRHACNVSSMKHYPFMKMLKNRITLCLEYIRR